MNSHIVLLIFFSNRDLKPSNIFLAEDGSISVGRLLFFLLKMAVFQSARCCFDWLKYGNTLVLVFSTVI